MTSKVSLHRMYLSVVGKRFQALGVATEKAHSPNLRLVRGTT